MNKVEHMLLEQMEEEKFHQVVADNFDFVDSLVDQIDLERISDEEDSE